MLSARRSANVLGDSIPELMIPVELPKLSLKLAGSTNLTHFVRARRMGAEAGSIMIVRPLWWLQLTGGRNLGRQLLGTALGCNCRRPSGVGKILSLLYCISPSWRSKFIVFSSPSSSSPDGRPAGHLLSRLVVVGQSACRVARRRRAERN